MRMFRVSHLLPVMLGAFAFVWCGAGCASRSVDRAQDASLAARAQAALVDALEREEKFIKVHAAEVLIGRGEEERVRGTFLGELQRNDAVTGYRIGIWRVLAGAAPDDRDRAQWLARITAAALDPAGADKVHAFEALAKLGQRVDGQVRRVAQTMAETAPEADAVFAWWVLHLAGDGRALVRISADLAAKDPLARLRAAYVIRWEQIKDPTTLAALAQAAENEPRSALGYAVIRSAGVAFNANPEKTDAWRREMQEMLATGLPSDRYQICLSLQEMFSTADLPRLTLLLDHEHGDVRVGAAAAILAVLERAAQPGGR